MTDGSGITARELRKVLFSVALFTVLLIYGLRFIAAITGVILVFALTLLIALVLNPLVTWAEKKRIPRSVSAAILAFTALMAVFALLWLISPLVVRQFRLLVDQIPHYSDRISAWIRERAPSLSTRIPTSTGEFLTEFGGSIKGVVGYAWNIIDVFASLIVVFLGTVYILANPEPLAKGLLAMFPHNTQDRVVAIVKRIGEQVRGWALATLGGMFVIFLLTWIALSIVGIQPAFLFAVIAGLLEVVPIIGPVLSAVPPGFAALATDPIKALYVVIAFIIIQQMESHIVIPILQGASLKLHPVSIIFVVLVMAGLFGIVGVFLAVPTAAVIKVLYEELYIKPADKDHEEIEKKADEIIRRNNQGE